MPANGTIQTRPLVRPGLNRVTGIAQQPLCVGIPAAIQEIIREMGAYYQKEPMAVQQGLDADHRRNLAYLGTYFPRTLIEIITAWAELLAVAPIRRQFVEKRVIHLASFGSGIGGDVFAALHALFREEIQPEKICVYSFDGNEDALNKQRHIMAQIIQRKIYPFEIEYQCHPFIWGFDRQSFAKSCEEIRQKLPETLDLVQASKWLNEFYNYHCIHRQNCSGATGIVKEWLQFAEGLLSRTGMVLLADITTRDCGTWFPEIINRETEQYHRNHTAGLKTISPIPCALQNGICQSANSCYTRREFAVRSCFCSEDRTQLCYRAFAPMEFAQDIIKSYRPGPYRVNWERNVDCQHGVRGQFITSAIAPCGFSAYVQVGGES